jgi:hypothetical protein
LRGELPRPSIQRQQCQSCCNAEYDCTVFIAQNSANNKIKQTRIIRAFIKWRTRYYHSDMEINKTPAQSATKHQYGTALHFFDAET